jgi:hypothetical protein
MSVEEEPKNLTVDDLLTEKEEELHTLFTDDEGDADDGNAQTIDSSSGDVNDPFTELPKIETDDQHNHFWV